ncbi:MAG: aminopeptidase N [Gammaproteobacteria bacterium]|nr:aminopeptidase N [Gammaproteobacteria bacterium]
MKPVNTHRSALGGPCILAAAGLIWGCAEVRVAPEPEHVLREAAAVLSAEDAGARSARVRNVAYDLEFQLDGEADEYTGRVRTAFELTDARATLTVDFAGGRVASVRVNGSRVDASYNGYFVTLPASSLRTGSNVVEIAFSHPYSADGSGVYRFRDPVDGRDYLYTDFEPFDANRLFPCFDQPDLKATFATRATVPADWQVVSVVAESGVENHGDTSTWTFPRSARISTYVYALHAGHYRQWESAAGEIPLRLFARESVADYIYPEHWFVPTRQGFEFFQDYFGIAYPFGKYDQVIVPHFNAGAMENVGAVTFSERFLRRGTVTRQARRWLASVILHEMAHMWFGNLVTMQWWNGLWLNESFATFMATLALVEATDFSEGGLGAYLSTVRAYQADERDTTHPIELPTPDTDAAFANFDAITYNKGSATLTQLHHLVGPEVFRQGVSAYLRAHAYGNTTIDDFLAEISKAAGLELEGWAGDWLHQPGTNAVTVDLNCEDGRITGMSILQTAPAAWQTLRTHRTQLGLYNFSDGDVSVRRVPVTYAGTRTEVEAVVGGRCPEFVYANHGDWDYARVDFDREALAALGDHLNEFADPLARLMLWQGIYDMVLHQRLSPLEFIDIALANVDAEGVDDVTSEVLDALQGSWSYLRRLVEDPVILDETGARIEGYLWRAFLESEPGSDRQLLFFDHYLAAATSQQSIDRIARLLGESDLPEGFVFDQDRRWSAIALLSGHDHPAAATALAAERKRDLSDAGRRRAVSAEAARPDPANQKRLMDLLLDPDSGLSVADAWAHASGLFPDHQHELQLKIVAEVFERLQSVSDRLDPFYFRAVAEGLLGTICDAGYLELVEQAVERSHTLHPSLAKRVRNLRFDVKRCLAIGEVLASPG